MRNPRAIRILHPVADELYQYRLGDRLDPGAMAEIFEPLFSNPLYSFRGAGRIFTGSIRPLPNAPLVFVNGRQTLAGLGGIIAGQFIMQPLIDDGSSGS